MEGVSTGKLLRAYISGAVDADILLRGLEESARGITNYWICLNGASERTSTKRTPLRLMKTIDGRKTHMIIWRSNSRTLVASLDNEKQVLAEATAKHRLAALLIPLVTEYIGTHNADVTTEDRIRIVFGETAEILGRGKRCILFAEDAANHSRPRSQSGKSLSSSGAEYSSVQSQALRDNHPKLAR
jgi:hypothetical protein